MPLSVVILAAGQGKRMNSDLPKVLQPLAGEPLLGHVLNTVEELGARTVQVVYGHGGEQVKAVFAERAVSWVLQSEQLGTGHAAQQAMPGLADDDHVLILFGDVPLVRTATLRQLVERVSEDSIALLSVRLPNPTGYGRVIRDGAQNVVRIVEHKDANTKERTIDEIFTGLLAAPARHLRRWLAQLRNDNAQSEYYLTDVITMAVREQIKVHAIVTPNQAEVQGVNDKVQLAELEAALRRERALELMRQGVTLADPARIDIRGKVTVGRDVFIDVNVVLVGAVHLGDRVRIGPNNYIENCDIGAGTQVFPNCVMERARVGASCNVGPFARLRPEAELDQDVHIGNFVEVKKSHLGAGSKANHLSYIGDATIGSKVNIGAGTITCNYDGVNKWRTDIGDGAFVGSGCMLVAPVKIGANANIGAGSTISREAPEGKLTLARARQTTIEQWQRPQKKPG